MTSALQAIVLGVVQGLTEFLPISSQAHLLLIPYFFNWDYQGLGFDIALHWGTLTAVILVFWRDYLRYLKALFKKPAIGAEMIDKKMAHALIVATIPAAILGYLFEAQAETTFRNPWITVFTLTGFALLLWWVDRSTPTSQDHNREESHRTDLAQPSFSSAKALFIGLAQAVAIVPGVSRSGATITAGLFTGLSREQATRFSFLLSGPIIFGAGLVASRDLISFSGVLLLGFVAAAVSGFLTIKFLLRYVSHHSFSIFVVYRLVLAGFVLALLIF